MATTPPANNGTNSNNNSISPESSAPTTTTTQSLISPPISSQSENFLQNVQLSNEIVKKLLAIDDPAFLLYINQVINSLLAEKNNTNSINGGGTKSNNNNIGHQPLQRTKAVIGKTSSLPPGGGERHLSLVGTPSADSGLTGEASGGGGSNHAPGMSALGDWLRLMRLHKYQPMLIRFSYEELLLLNEETLPPGFTKGGGDKLLREVANLHTRRQLANDFLVALEGPPSTGPSATSSSTSSTTPAENEHLARILEEIRNKLIITPMRRETDAALADLVLLVIRKAVERVCLSNDAEIKRFCLSDVIYNALLHEAFSHEQLARLREMKDSLRTMINMPLSRTMSSGNDKFEKFHVTRRFSATTTSPCCMTSSGTMTGATSVINPSASPNGKWPQIIGRVEAEPPSVNEKNGFLCPGGHEPLSRARSDPSRCRQLGNPTTTTNSDISPPLWAKANNPYQEQFRRQGGQQHQFHQTSPFLSSEAPPNPHDLLFTRNTHSDPFGASSFNESVRCRPFGGGDTNNTNSSSMATNDYWFFAGGRVITPPGFGTAPSPPNAHPLQGPICVKRNDAVIGAHPSSDVSRREEIESQTEQLAESCTRIALSDWK